jgi:hypothetical protein
VIGEGANSKVVRAHHLPSGKDFALKLHLDNNAPEEFLVEKTVFEKIGDHKNIIKCHKAI